MRSEWNRSDERLKSRVGKVHDSDVGLDRRERVVGREHRLLGQRVEERRLADIGKTDDRDSKSHEGQGYRHPERSGRDRVLREGAILRPLGSVHVMTPEPSSA